MAESKELKIGDRAPAFDLPAFPDGRIKLSQFKGKQNVVLYFYPRDNTPGCTTEACDFRDALPQFGQADTVVLGISTDDVASHRKFSEKFTLPFPLLADTDHAVAEKFGVWVEKSNYGKKYMGIRRSTFLINKQGKIAAIWSNVKVANHVATVHAALTQPETQH